MTASDLPSLDVAKLADALEAKRWARRISWRQVAREAGITPNVTTRLTDPLEVLPQSEYRDIGPASSRGEERAS